MDAFKENQEMGEGNLDTFREQWRRELGSRQAQNPEQDDKKQEDQDDDVHVQARTLFLQGVQLEESGNLYDAILYYKKAEKLVPNIERQTFAYTGRNIMKKEPSADNQKKDEQSELPDTNNEDDKEMSNLVSKFTKLTMSKGKGIPLIEPEFETNSSHIGSLPFEVINYILKWVVSSDLDLSSLERCSEVCRGFYLASRDEDIWRLVCTRTWGTTLVNVYSSNLYSGWRDMFLSKPRVNYSGCYISKHSYMREGERGFQDHESHRSWHIVQYYRFFRFFPGGQVVMVTSSDDKALVAKQLNTYKGCLNIQGAMIGNYKIVDSVLVCVLHLVKEKKKPQPLRFKKKKQKNAMFYHEVPEQHFHMEFIIEDNWKRLMWNDYNIVSKYKSGVEKTDQVDVRNQNNNPRLVFKWMESYHFESNSPLV